ncbi:MAG: translation initiation factor IF-2, partial [Phycisphaerae bacterium]
VRIEPPEQIRRPAVTGRAPEAAGPPAQIGPPRPGRRGKGKPLPLNLQPELAEEVGRPKHRAHPRRSARVGEAGERLREWRDRDLIERQERLEAATGRGIRQRRAVETRRAAAPTPAVRKEKVQIAEPITVRAFCSATGIGQNQVIPKLMEHGVLATVTQTIDTELAELIALDFGLELAVVRQRSALDVLQAEFESRQRANLRPRPPVVAFLGHVDHGKTSLLDRIRQTAVAEAEAGGITQHIGAYCVQKGDARVTFIDTPGHEAFTAMRARGANMTDVVVLVVAADDGVMPQTVEAINHARAAKVPIVVALNKIDLPGVDINRVYTQLAEQRLVPQDWGGDIDVIKTSAVTGEGIDELIDHLHALAELLELQADPTVPATGTVIEASMSEGQGVVATLLIQDGSLREGDILVCGRGYGRVRAMRDERGRRLKLAGPSTPVSVSGLDELPQAGDRFYQLDDLKRAKTIAEERRQQLRLESLAEVSKARSLSELLAQQRTAEVPELNVILRADVQGSLDVLSQQLEQLPGDQVRLRILHAGLGAITEGDVILAQASQAVVIGFHVVPEERARQLAEQQGVQIRLYRVIYEVTDDIRQALEGLLAPEKRFESRGKAEVRQLFHISRLGTVAGCMVVDGLIARQYRVRVI